MLGGGTAATAGGGAAYMGGGGAYGEGAGAGAGTCETDVWVCAGGTTAPVAASIRCRRGVQVRNRRLKMQKGGRAYVENSGVDDFMEEKCLEEGISKLRVRY